MDTVEEIERLKQRLREERPQAWDDLPDLDLYMDQVISYMPRQLIHFDGEEILTSAMVNNYIKDGMLPRAEGKRYGRKHLAYLTAICALKQVLSVRETDRLIAAGTERIDTDASEAYALFCSELDAALDETAQRLEGDVKEEDLPRLALSLALHSYAHKLACQRVLEMIQPDLSRGKKGREKGKKPPVAENGAQ